MCSERLTNGLKNRKMGVRRRELEKGIRDATTYGRNVPNEPPKEIILLLFFFALFRSPPACFFHSTSVNLATRLTSSTTNQYQKICPGVLTNVNPFATQSSATTLSTAPTTAATVIPIPTIGVDGLQYFIFILF